MSDYYRYGIYDGAFTCIGGEDTIEEVREFIKERKEFNKNNNLGEETIYVYRLNKNGDRTTEVKI